MRLRNNYNQRRSISPARHKRAKEAYEYARSEYEQKQKLFEKISFRWSWIIAQYFRGCRSHQQSLLAVLFEKQYVAVAKAVKYQNKDGRKHVRLRVENTSGGGADFKKLINLDDELFRSLQPDVVNDVYISLLNDANAIISQPYEAKIEQLRYGQPVEMISRCCKISTR
jgi:hypothetical protein